MLKNYFKIAYRNIIRHKAYSFINLSGLAIGMASSILILLWVQNELSYDKFNTNAKQIYRVVCSLGDFKAAVNPAVMSPTLKQEMPVIKDYAMIQGTNEHLFEVGTRKFEEKRTYYATPSFLTVFSYPLVKGDPATALNRIDGILITEDMAKKYFGNDDAMGKVLRIDNGDNVVVTGILANVSANSHLQFDFIQPMAFLAKTNDDIKKGRWDNFNFFSYVQLDKNFVASPEAIARLNNQINQIYIKHNTEIKVKFVLQPLTDIHLRSNYQGDPPGAGNEQYVRIFFIVAFLILITACINFMNLATARSARRAKEIGLRKVSGAIRGHIILQFLSESVLISFLALLLAMGLVWLFLPLFNDLAGKKIVINYLDVKLWLGLIGIAFVTGIVSGSYPALFLSGFNPVKVLKGNMKAMGGNLIFRNMLVITQFIVSILLLIGTFTIYNQLKFIRNRNPGFEKDNLVYIPLTGDLHNKMQALKGELQQNRLTSNYSVVSDLPTNLMNGTISVEWTGKDPKSQTIFPNLEIDENFIQTFKMKMVSGRSFSKAYPSDSNNYVVNEKALSVMGMNAANAVGKPLSLWGRKGMIIGVVKDFNFKPVQQAIEPLILYTTRGNSNYVVVRAAGGTIEPTIKALEKIEQDLNPAYPFKYDFLDQDLANMYKGEQQMGSIFNLFAGLAIFISCLGLYGLSAFMAEQRTKEIGVRKVLGASLVNIVTMLSGGITRLIAIAIVIAIPLSWYAANTWLNGFAYHISVSWLLFLVASLSALLIAWITVSYETIKAAMANPIKSIKAE